MKKLLLINLLLIQGAILAAQFHYQPYQSTYVPNNSVQISLELNKRYKENRNVRNLVLDYCRDLKKFELESFEISSINRVYENINYWDERGDYENATTDFITNYLLINPIYEKYHPNASYDLCADLMDDVLRECNYYTGLTFTSMFLNTVWFYYQGSKYYAIVEFNESYRSPNNLTKNRRYVYCGLTLQEVDEFLKKSLETYGDKFHRLINPNECSCD